MTHTRNAQASPKRALAPDLSALEDRAVRAWTERMAVTPLGGGCYAVEGERGARYAVDLPERRCTCPDHTYRRERCKHLRRVAIEINEGRIPPPGQMAVGCADCGARTFVPEGDEPPHFCADCRLEPGDRVIDRETGDRLAVAAVTDRRAHEYELPGTGGTVADYPTNRGYADADIVVEAVYPSSPADRRYAFPRARLERAVPGNPPS